MQDDSIFDWLYGFLLMRRPDLATYVTCTGKTDGIGAQAQAVLSTQALARAFGIGYAHTPFRSVAHSPGDPVRWAAQWEAFLGLGDGEVPAATVSLPAVTLRNLVEQPERWREQPLLIAVDHSHAFTDRNADAYARIAARSRLKYAGSSKASIPLHRGPQDFTVAVHLRRGDVGHDDGARFTSDGRVLRVVAALQRALNALGVRSVFNLYSEGVASDFAAFAELGMQLHIGDDLFGTFHNMMSADVFVMAKSSLSYAAALLCEGIVVYEPFWHVALDDWVCLGKRGISSEMKLMRALERRLRNHPRVAAPRERIDTALAELQSEPSTLLGSPLVGQRSIMLPVCDASSLQNAELGAYGSGIANFVPRFGQRASVSWCIEVPEGVYDISAEYAAGESRPMHLLINGELMTTVCMETPTTGWFEADLQWQPIGRVGLSSAAHVMTVYREGDMPHLRRLKLTAI